MIRRLGVFVTHPIQNQVPVWRGLSETVDVMVHYFSDQSLGSRTDPDFGLAIAWDVPMLDGYAHRFVSRDADLARHMQVRLPHAERCLAEGGFDAVLLRGYTHGFEWQVARAARRLGLRTLLWADFCDRAWHPRGLFKTVAREAALRCFYRHVDMFCPVGVEGERHLTRHGIPAHRIHRAPYSVDSALFESQYASLDRAEARGALGIEDGRLAVLFSGKLIPRKDPLLLIEALERVRDVHLVVVGDGPLREAVRARAARLPAATLAGFVNQRGLGRYFRAADVFALPSHFESWGLVVNEAMHFGLPSVVSDQVGCWEDLVLSGETGFVFPDGDVGALASHLRRFVEDADLARRLGANARARVRDYSTERTLEGLRSALGHG